MIGLYIVMYALVFGAGIAFGSMAIEVIKDGDIAIGTGLLVIIVGLVVGLTILITCPPKGKDVPPPQPTEVVVHMTEE